MISYGLAGYKNRTLTPQYTIVHHTAGTDSLNICLYGRGDLPGPLCQYLISKDGTVHHITDGYANHVGEARPGFSNYNCIGIELENLGNGADPYPEPQLAAARALCVQLGLPVLGHKEICSPVGRKIDPSFDMDAFRASLLQEEPEVLQPDERDALLNINHWVREGFKQGPYYTPLNLLENFNALSTRLAALEARPVASVTAADVDLDALAEAVADKLAARLAN
jgi:hypothetical protein